MQVRKSWILLAAFVFTVSGVPSSYAENDAVTKLSRGVVNIVTSPLEFITQYMVLEEDHNTAVSVLGGVVYGAGYTVTRILAGAYEVITFPIPYPSAYEPVMRPATPIDAFQAMAGKAHE